jgi:hypothetical protein
VTNLDYAALRNLLEALEIPAATNPGELRFRAAALNESLKVGRSAKGFPALLVAAAEVQPSQPFESLRNLRVLTGVELSLLEGEAVLPAANYSVLECTSDNPATEELFLRVICGLVDQLSDPATFATSVSHLLELFRRRTRAGTRAITGLWAELLTIVDSSQVGVAVAAWHSQPGNVHDFALGGSCAEVKACSNGSRRHLFGSSQLAGDETLVISYLVEPSDGGLSVFDLYSQIRTALAPDFELLQSFEVKFADTLGNCPDADIVRFDVNLARRGRKLLSAREVPRLLPPFPMGVSGVRFTADLNCVSAAEAGEIQATALGNALIA